MTIIRTEIAQSFTLYRKSQTTSPVFIAGNAFSVLQCLPTNSIDFCMTSPPYWGKREYQNGGIGLEVSYQEYISNLLDIFKQVKRVLKPTGSFWLNIGDTYLNKSLLGIPWRVTIDMIENQSWILRNSIIWNKVKGGPDNSTDRLRNVHENIFHFVKSHSYYYDADAVRSNPKKSKVVNGAIVSATGVSGVRYKRQIELSTSLSEDEKKNALCALDKMLEKIIKGDIADFRMIIRGQQRTTHSELGKGFWKSKRVAR